MEYLPLTFFLGAVIGFAIGSHITRAYWLDQIKELERIMTFPAPTPSPLRACELCRHGIENRDAGPPVLMCMHKLTRHGGKRPQPCSEARREGQRCGPDAALWDSRSEALARVQGVMALPTDPHAWTGSGPAPAWWWTKDGTKVYRDRQAAIDD